MRVFNNRVLTKTFGSEGKGAAAGWRWPCSEELRDVYFSPFIITKIHEEKCGGGGMWQGRGRTALYGWFYGETRRKRTALKTLARRKDNIKKGLNRLGKASTGLI